jgi:hypothetical protein
MLAKSIIMCSVVAVAQARTITARAATAVYDGRVKAAATAKDFDSSTSPFGKDDVKGQSQCSLLPSARMNTYQK